MTIYSTELAEEIDQFMMANPEASERAVARNFGIWQSKLNLWCRNKREYGIFGPRPRGKDPHKIDQYQSHIDGLVDANPTITTLAIQNDLHQTFKFSVSESVIGRALLRYGFPPPKVRRELVKLADNKEAIANSVKEVPTGAYKLSKVKVIALKAFVSFFYGLCASFRLKDPRTGPAIKYRAKDVLLLAFFACLAGQTKFKDIVSYCENNAWYFHQFMDLPPTMFNEDTLTRVLGGLKIKTIRKIFYQGVFEGLTKRLFRAITLDGKIGRGWGSKAKNRAQIGVATAVSQVGKHIIDSVDFLIGEEIEAVRELLRSIDIKALWITADALHCNLETVKLILFRGARYCLRLRKNQRKLSAKVHDYLASRKSNDGTYKTTELGHGRTTIRRVNCYELGKKMQQYLNFPSLKMIAVCHTYTLDAETETRIYLFSQVCKPELAALLIRNHWCVESVHWELDTNMGEDDHQATNRNAIRVLSVLTRAATNMLRIFNTNDSNRAVMKRISFNPQNLTAILTGFATNKENYINLLKEEAQIYKRLENQN